MIMPFIRLVAIYVIVIMAVVAFFKRDQIMAVSGLSSGAAQQSHATATAAPTATPVVSTAEPVPAQIPDPAVETAGPAGNGKADEPASAAPVQVIAEQPARPDPAPLVQPTATAPESAPLVQPTADTPSPAPLVQPTATTPTRAPETTQTRLNEARNAYWSGDLGRAEALFAALARDLPDNADVNGELGNILFAQRRYDEAADAYLATGKLLVNSGRRAQAIPLITVLHSIAPQKAAVLRNMVTN